MSKELGLVPLTISEKNRCIEWGIKLRRYKYKDFFTGEICVEWYMEPQEDVRGLIVDTKV
jgi:hypothetical protein